MKNTQTAVDWLEDSFRINFNKIFVYTDFGLISQLFKQAKEMEKQQIIDAANHGVDYDKSPFKNAEEYYNQTYLK